MTSRAVVFGAGMAGLLAARVLTERYDQVTLVERDVLSGGPRKGVPQGRHPHQLFTRGQQLLADLFPGIIEELITAGAVPFQPSLQGHLVIEDQPWHRVPMPHDNLAASRPLLEDQLRRRVLDLPGVRLLDGTDAVAPVISNGRVIAARVGRDQRLSADLVVDALGRAGRATTWLADNGYRPPRTDKLALSVVYASCHFRLPADPFAGDEMVLIAPTSARPCGLVLARIDRDEWILTLASYGAAPPTDLGEFLDYAERLAPEHMQVVRTAQRVGQIRRHRFPHTVRRRYECLRTLPRGMIAIGDAVCVSNPLYAQGMTTAALHAHALRRCLRADAGTECLERRYFAAAAQTCNTRWKLQTTNDLIFLPGRQTPLTYATTTYLRRLATAAAQHPECATAYLRVLHAIDHPYALLKPALLRRALFPGPSRPTASHVRSPA
ncbi:hypothetical protein SMC26_15795 [Actinomadura fulvescens]|uniref:FAD-dependent monooxygenase n=1 Tax=Actinomadura fulvescens TaxID=46160 RepID=A0ABP6D6A8_9ACTN